MPQSAVAPRPALRFYTPAKTALFRVPYFPQGIPAGFPSPPDDHLQKALDLHECVHHPLSLYRSCGHSASLGRTFATPADGDAFPLRSSQSQPLSAA